MLKLKVRSPLAAPAREDGTLLPAALAGLLAAMLVGQLMLPSPVELPTPVLGMNRLSAPGSGGWAAPARADGGIVVHNLFAPGRSQVGILGKVPGIALGGVVVAGTMGRGARMRAVIVKPGGILVMLPLGGLINGWQLVRLQPDHAEFRRGTSKLDMVYGGAIPPAGAGDADAGANAGQGANQ